jgi:hypothetical protein
MVTSMNNIRAVASLASLVLFATTALSAQANKSTPCTASEYRQLDFWVGDWDAFDVDNQKEVAARAHISSILEGCSVMEDYQQIDGLHGESFSTYDASRKVWHQTWVTNRGSLLVVEGKMEGNKLVLKGTDNIRKADVRVTWEADEKGVRETAVSSKDGGKTWEPVFDMVFRPHSPNTARR